MHIVTRIIAMSRGLRLGREFREIERVAHAFPPSARPQLALLTMKELAQAGRCEFPHLYGTPPEQRYSPWGSGTDTGLARARSDNPQVRMRGIALWLAVVFHETRNSPHPALQEQHRQVLRVLRQLKQSIQAVERGEEHNAWTEAAKAVA